LNNAAREFSSGQVFRHYKIVHDKSAADVRNHGLRDAKTIPLAGGNGFGIALVHGENQPLRAELAAFALAMGTDLLPRKSAKGAKSLTADNVGQCAHQR